MRINIIHDSRRMERFEPLMEELSKQGITDYEVWPCILLDDVVSSINASHKMIVRDAKEKGLPEVCIAEDDLFFPAADGWQHFLHNKPKTYDLYLAATYGSRKQKQPVGFHLYCVHEKFYDSFLSVPDNVHIDTAMWFARGQDFHFCYPFAALQRPGFSQNNMAVVNYNKVLLPEDIYQ